MTFGVPGTRTQVLTYKANGSRCGLAHRGRQNRNRRLQDERHVRLAADRDTEPESGTTTDDRKVLTDTDRQTG